MHGDTRGPVRVRVCCAPFTLLRLLTLHCTRRRGAAEGEGAQQTERGAADAKACRRRPGGPPRTPGDPEHPHADRRRGDRRLRGPRPARSIRPRDRVRGDRRRPRRRHRTDAPCRSSGSGPGRPRSSGRNRFGARSAPPPRRPPPAALPEQPRRARPIPRGPTHRGGGRAVAREGLDGGDSSHRYGGDRHGARLLRGGPAPVVRRRSRPALRCGSCAKTPGEGGRTPEPAPAPEGQATGQPRDVVAGMLPTCDVASALRA